MAMSWQVNKTVLETNEYMLTNEIMCDVTFLMGKNKTPVRCHKYMLISRSPVFFTMFSDEWATTNTIEILDIEPEIMKLLLRYVYTDTCSLTGNNVMGILYAARKYNIQALEKECASFLEKNMCADNVFVILEQAAMFNDEGLYSKCKEYILANASELLKSDGFNTMYKDTLAEIISSDNLAVSDELVVYEACKRWAEAQCEALHNEPSPENIREALGEILFMIRFPLLSADDFTKRVSFDNILSFEDQVHIFRYLTVASKENNFSFNPKPRCEFFNSGPLISVERFHNTRCSHVWPNQNYEDALSFKISKKSHLVGVSLYSRISREKVTGEFKVLDNDKTLFSKHVTLSYSGSITEDLLFKTPVLLQPGIVYTLSQKFRGGNTFYGKQGKEHVEVGDLEITFFKSDLCRNSTDVEYGQFPKLLLR